MTVESNGPANEPLRDAGLFREQALRRLNEPEFGEIMRLAPVWAHWSWSILLAVATLSGVYVSTRSVSVFESGAGVVRIDDQVDARCRLIAMVPIRVRPRLAAGMRIQCRIQGYPDSRVEAVVDSMGDRAIAPGQLAIPPLGPVGNAEPMVPVFARIGSKYFRSEGRDYRLFDGMNASVRIELGRERLVARLLPGRRAA